MKQYAEGVLEVLYKKDYHHEDRELGKHKEIIYFVRYNFVQ
jgi:hypothetical protein